MEIWDKMGKWRGKKNKKNKKIVFYFCLSFKRRSRGKWTTTNIQQTGGGGNPVEKVLKSDDGKQTVCNGDYVVQCTPLSTRAPCVFDNNDSSLSNGEGLKSRT